jgi:hypothetical protein
MTEADDGADFGAVEAEVASKGHLEACSTTERYFIVKAA